MTSADTAKAGLEGVRKSLRDLHNGITLAINMASTEFVRVKKTEMEKLADNLASLEQATGGIERSLQEWIDELYDREEEVKKLEDKADREMEGDVVSIDNAVSAGQQQLHGLTVLYKHKGG